MNSEAIAEKINLLEDCLRNTFSGVAEGAGWNDMSGGVKYT